jgi:hypothetical protein
MVAVGAQDAASRHATGLKPLLFFMLWWLFDVAMVIPGIGNKIIKLLVCDIK